jgi:hypothetical protein
VLCINKKILFLSRIVRLTLAKKIGIRRPKIQLTPCYKNWPVRAKQQLAGSRISKHRNYYCPPTAA